MVTLNYEDSKKFWERVEEDLKHPVGPIPTPKLKAAVKMILEDMKRLEKLSKKAKRIKGTDPTCLKCGRLLDGYYQFHRDFYLCQCGMKYKGATIEETKTKQKKRTKRSELGCVK